MNKIFILEIFTHQVEKIPFNAKKKKCTERTRKQLSASLGRIYETDPIR